MLSTWILFIRLLTRYRRISCQVAGSALTEQKPYLASTSSVDVPDEKKNISGTLGLLELAKWAQEQQWKGSPDLSTNHDAYFLKAAKEDLEFDDDDEDDELLEVERQTSE